MTKVKKKLPVGQVLLTSKSIESQGSQEKHVISGTNIISVGDFLSMNSKKPLVEKNGHHQRLTSLPAIASDNNLHSLPDLRRFSDIGLAQTVNLGGST